MQANVTDRGREEAGEYSGTDADESLVDDLHAGHLALAVIVDPLPQLIFELLGEA
jgi:hypothetical protein